MLVTTQWPLKPAATSPHLPGFVFYGCLESLTELSALWFVLYYRDVIIGAMASQITSLTIVYSTVYSGEDQRKHHSSASLAFLRGIHWWPVNIHDNILCFQCFQVSLPYADDNNDEIVLCKNKKHHNKTKKKRVKYLQAIMYCSTNCTVMETKLSIPENYYACSNWLKIMVHPPQIANQENI